MLSHYDRENIENILGGDGDWFTAHLIRLIRKADSHNKRLLAKGFPEEVAAVTAWLSQPYDAPDLTTQPGQQTEGEKRLGSEAVSLAHDRAWHEHPKDACCVAPYTYTSAVLAAILPAHDARIRAQTLREAADAAHKAASQPDSAPSDGLTSRRLVWDQVARWLEARAAAEVGE